MRPSTYRNSVLEKVVDASTENVKPVVPEGDVTV